MNSLTVSLYYVSIHNHTSVKTLRVDGLFQTGAVVMIATLTPVSVMHYIPKSHRNTYSPIVCINVMVNHLQ